VGQQNIFEHAIIGGLLTKLNQMCEKNLTLPFIFDRSCACASRPDRALPIYGCNTSQQLAKTFYRHRDNARAAYPASSGHLLRWSWYRHASGNMPRVQAHTAEVPDVPDAPRGHSPWQSRKWDPEDPPCATDQL